jgi:putative solute:sodium symporter small subunit
VSAPEPNDSHRRYWRSNLRVTSVLMLVWFIVSFGVTYFARELNFSFFGWPFSFWVAAQGALIVYGLIIAYYAHTMNRLDRAHGVAEDA